MDIKGIKKKIAKEAGYSKVADVNRNLAFNISIRVGDETAFLMLVLDLLQNFSHDQLRFMFMEPKTDVEAISQESLRLELASGLVRKVSGFTDGKDVNKMVKKLNAVWPKLLDHFNEELAA